MRLNQAKKFVRKSELWKGVTEALIKDISDEDQLFLESVADILVFDLNDLCFMWAYTSPGDRIPIKISFQKMMEDKIKGTLHEGKKDKEWYRQYGIKEAKKIEEEIMKEPCEVCKGTGKIENSICIACSGTGKKKESEEKENEKCATGLHRIGL